MAEEFIVLLSKLDLFLREQSTLLVYLLLDELSEVVELKLIEYFLLDW